MTKLTQVKSSSVEAIGYDHARAMLIVKFINGKTYGYHNTPLVLYRNMESADSVGQYFNKNIRDKYKYTMLLEEKK